MAKQRILYITEEIAPYLPENENGILGRTLPKKSQDNGYEVRIFMPRFGCINERRNQLHEVIRLSGINIPINDADHPLIIKVASMHPSRIQVYFIDNDDYFQRSAEDLNPLGTNRVDNDDRSIFFTRGTMETVKKLRWEASVIHCIGWMTGLNPLYIRTLYSDGSALRDSKIVYTILPGQMPEALNGNILEKLRLDGVPESELKPFVDQPNDPELIHKIAIRYSDAVVISAPVFTHLAEYAKTLNKEVLVCTEPGEDALDKCLEIYNTICPNED